jgi:hypothetical protein
MGKDLHSIDHLFRNAQKDFEEEPSSAVWEKITCKLDHDFDVIKKEGKLFSGLRRILFLLVFIMAGFALNRYKINSHALLIGKSDLIYIQQGKSGIEKDSGSEATLIAPANIYSKTFLQKSKDKLFQPKSADKPGEEYLISHSATQIKSLLNPISEPLLQANNALPGTQKKTTASVEFTDMGMQRPAYKGTVILLNNSRENILDKAQLSKNSMKFSAPVDKKGELLSKVKRKWALSILASNDWGGYFINDEKLDRSGIPHDENEEISGREHHEESFSVSVFLSRYFTDKFIVKGGITYSNTAIGINPQYIYASKDPGGTLAYKYVTSSGYDFLKPSFGNPLTIGDSLYSTEAKHKLKTISLQIMPGYTLRKNKLSITPAAGLLVGYIARATLRTEVEDSQHSEMVFVDRLAGSRKFYAGFVTDVSLAYNFTKKWSLFLIPSFRVNLSPVTTTDFIKTYPFSFSLGAGVSYSF